MHQSFLKSTTSIVLTVCIVFAMAATFALDAVAAPALPAVNTETRHAADCTSLSNDALAYYTGSYTYSRLSSLSGASDVSTSAKAKQNNTLYNELQTLMTTTHTYKTTYSGTGEGSLAYYWQRTDAQAGNAGSFVLVYCDQVVSINESGKFNREHVWPKSNASFNQSGGGSDLHHLRPADPAINSTRGNKPFGDVRKNGGTYTTGSCFWANSTYFEPQDNIKGDVARILLYVYTRWGENNIYSDTSNGGKIIESLDTLLDWIALDPVDTWEMKRNDLTEDVQGNRNVFIDYPELAYKMFGRSVPEGIVTPSSGGSSTVCTHTWTITSQTDATCTAAGTVVYTCSKCGDSYSETIAALGHIDENDDDVCDRCGETLTAVAAANKYVIAAEKDGTVYIMPSDGTVAQPLAKAVTLTGDMVSESDAEGYSFEIEDISGSFPLICGNGKYLSWNSSTSFSYSDTAVECEVGEFGIRVPASTGRYIRLFTNTTSGVSSFRPYQGAQSGTEITYLLPVAAAAPGSHKHSWGDWYSNNDGTHSRDCGNEDGKCPAPTETVDCTYTAAITAAPTCVDVGVKTCTCTVCGYSYTEEIAATGIHVDADDDGVCDVCGAEVEAQANFALTSSVSNGMHLMIYHPASNKFITSTVSNNRILGAEATVVNGEVLPPEEAAVFVAEYGTGGFYLKCGGRYLTSGETGNALFLLDEPNACSLWTTSLDEQGGFVYLNNINAHFREGDTQSLEYYSGAFTTYGLKQTSAYQYSFYATPGHVWDAGVVTTEPTTTSEGVKTCTCTLCGETKEVSIPALSNPTGDVSLDGRVTIYDVTYLLNALRGIAEVDLAVMDLDGSGDVNIADVTSLLGILTE